MQGKGAENCFLGVMCPIKQARIVIQPVAFDQTTTYIHGSDKGPRALIQASRNLELYDIETKGDVSCREGIYTARESRFNTSAQMLNMTYEATRDYLSSGKFVVTLGGEHAISYAPIRAHAEQCGPISVLQFDAHTDRVEAYEGNPHSHASVMARVKTLQAVEKIVSVGIRSMAEEEVREINTEDVFFAHQLEGKDWMERVIDRLGDRVYITFDLDAFDSSLMPSTGTPEPGGLSWNQATELLKKVILQRDFVGFDVVELCPIPGFWAPDFLAAKLVYKILSYLYTN